MSNAASELVITRTFNAPQDRVWAAFTSAENLAQWWGPKGFQTQVHRFDLEPEGLFLYSMSTENGQQMWGRFVYEAIEPKSRLVYVSSFSNEAGELTRAPFWEEQFPLEVRNEVTFEEADGKTTVTLRGKPIRATEAEDAFFLSVHPSMQAGFKGTLDQLEEFLN